MNKTDKILVLGGSGMVGKSLIQALKYSGYQHIFSPNGSNLDLKNQGHVSDYMYLMKFDYVFLLAAKVGGIQANIKSPATFAYDNVMIEANVINAAYESKVKKLLFMGSSCIYPRICQQPILEEYLLTGPLEPTNESYALAKIMGLKMCEAYNKQYGCNFISVMPSNIYGPNDHFDETSHVMSALIQRFHEAKISNLPSVTCFGTGMARREFTYVDDVTDACLFLMNNYNNSQHINIGTGLDITIFDLAHLIAKMVGYSGEIKWDETKPDGMPRRVVDTTKINNLGWTAKTNLERGIEQTYQWFLENIA